MEPTYQIQLDDYHMGEITGFESSAACKDRDIWENGHWPGHCAEDMDDGASPNKRTRPGMTVDVLYLDDEGHLLTGDDQDDASTNRWVLTGTLSQLREAYQELLTVLSEPAWHWYGMGGDDYCYDYWPNTMGLAAEFRDQLIERADKDAWNTIYNTQYLADDLCNIYWLARTRYARTNELAGVELAVELGTAENHDTYFENDILSHKDFGPCPAWLTR